MARSRDDSGLEEASAGMPILGGLIAALCAVAAAILHDLGYVGGWIVPAAILGAALAGLWVRRRRR